MLQRVWAALTQLLAAIANWRYFKAAVWIACLAPGALLAIDLWRFFHGNESVLGVDPNVTLLHTTGEYALGFLLTSLAVTPVRRIFHINRVQIVRRLLGVTAFFYALTHVGMYLVFDQLCDSLATCDFQNIWIDLTKRKFIFAGMVSFSILTVLAITSTTGWVRRLKKKWTTLHRLVYVAAIAGTVHFVWGQKSDILEPLKWAGFVAILLGIRVYFAWAKRRPKATGPRPQLSGGARTI